MGYGLGYYRRIDGSLAGQGVEDGDHHVADVHFEESAKSVAGVAASEAVSAEGVVRTRNPTGHLAGHQLQIVRDGHHGTFAIGQQPGDQRDLGSLQRVETVSSLHGQGLLAEPLIGGGAPKVDGYAPAVGQLVGGRADCALC